MGYRVWAPKPVYRSLKPLGYGPDHKPLRNSFKTKFKPKVCIESNTIVAISP